MVVSTLVRLHDVESRMYNEILVRGQTKHINNQH